MKIVMSWLEEYIDLKDYKKTPEVLAKKLTDAGLEVEGFEKLGGIENLVVGHILKLERHPDADRLTVCQVDIGLSEPAQIVCGATNHKQGDKVCAALPGCVLPGDFKIKKSKIRGVESQGMLCSDKEMGLSSESEGIKILDQSATVGQSVPELLNLSDVIFEISVTPNRADCLSHLGLAREISCLINKPLKIKDPLVKIGKTSINNRFKVEVKNSDLCPRFMGRWIENVKVKPSPDWLKRKLELAGLKSINNIVDITNYVMLEVGQPMHAYDFSEIEGQELRVESSVAGEKFTSFDGTEFKLTGDELTIRDKSKVLGLAGVIGSKFSGITQSTENVFLECAYFVPSSVRKTARRHGIETDAAYRFSRGTDIEMLPRAINLACELMVELAEGVVSKDTFDFYPQPLPKAQIKISKEDITSRLGFEATDKQFEFWLERLSCEFSRNAQDGYTVFPPVFRYDLNHKEDLIEEYGRLEGYDKIPEILPEMSAEPRAHESSYLNSRFITEALVSQGFYQAINYNFHSSSESHKFQSEVSNLTSYNLGYEGQAVKLKNPLSDKLDEMRSLLFPQLYQNALHNFKHGRSSAQIFEQGSVFFKKDSKYIEESRTALLCWGEPQTYWQSTRENKSFPVFDLKSQIEILFRKANISSYRFENASSKNPSPEFLHPSQWSAIFVKGKYVGVLGTVHPKILEDDKFRSSVAYSEINTDLITQDLFNYSKVKPLFYTPTVKRDLTFEVSKTVAFKDIHKVVNKSAGALFKGLDLKDIYEGDRLAADKMALTVTLYLQDTAKPIEDKILDQIQEKIFNSIKTEFT